MKKAQKNLYFLKISIPLILIFSVLPFYLYHLFFKVLVSGPIDILLIPTWFLAFLFYFKGEVFGFKVKKENREKVFFYAIFITFIVFYFAFFSGNLPIIIAQTTATTTTTLPTCSCSQCGFYSSSNCNYACNEWQNCIQSTCSASGCISNSNCYRCELKYCSGTSPRVYVLTPIVPSASYLKASVVFSCQEWDYMIKNLTLTLYIDNQEWTQCFLNKKGLVTDFGWNGTQMDDSSPNCKRGCKSCGNNGKWDCDNRMNCKHKDYDLWVYSNSTTHFVNITFTCRLPSLAPGTHTLTAAPTIYRSSIEMKPSKTTFMVAFTDGKTILQTLTQPFKVLLRIVFPFLI